MGALPVWSVSGVCGRANDAPKGRRDSAGAQPDPPLGAQISTSHQGLCGAKILCEGDGDLARHAALPGAIGGGNHGPGLRPRLHSRSFRHHPRPVHCLHLECLRHPWLARLLFPAGRRAPILPLSERGVVAGADVCRREDAEREVGAHPYWRIAGHRRGSAGSGCGRLRGCSASRSSGIAQGKEARRAAHQNIRI